MNEIDSFIERLICYRKGEGTVDEVEELFVKLDRFKHFQQFINDGAIRAKDIEFSVMQERALAKFLKLLRDKNFDEAEEITFLSEV
jgi:hypothetical protein